MATIDSEALLEPVAADDPAGPDLEYDPDFLAAFQAAEGTPERRMGDTVVAAEEPDWRRVQTLASGLLGRSKDLRVAVLLARAALRTSGIEGLAHGLALVRGLAERHWDWLHPQLDPSDDNDPTARVNCLLELCAREALLDALRATPLIRSRVFGPLCLRDIELAEGRIQPPEGVKPLDRAALAGAFQDCDPDDLTAAAAAASRALDETRGLNAALAARIPGERMPNLEPLTKPLATIAALLAQRSAERQPGVAAGAGSPETPAAPAPGPAAPAGEIRSRDDAVQAIDRICDYYSRNEPSSPVPLLLKRARRLATGSFMDIVRDLAPDALSQIEKVCGSEQES